MDQAQALSPDQQVAYDGIKAWLEDPNGKQTAGLTGYAGCGKTTVITRIAEEIGDIQYCAPTAQAVSVLNRKLTADRKAKTLHRFLRKYDLPKDPKCPSCDITLGASIMPTGTLVATILPKCPNCKFPIALEKIQQTWNYTLRTANELAQVQAVFADEASMIPVVIRNELLATGKKILFIGDSAQLRPIESDAFPVELDQPDWSLRTLHRQAADHPLRYLGLMARSQPILSLQHLAYPDKIVFRSITLVDKFIDHLWHNVSEEQVADQIFIVFKREDRVRYNRKIRQAIFGKDIGDYPVEGDRIMFVKNKKDSPVYNGLRGRVMSIIMDRPKLMKLRVLPDYETEAIEVWVEKAQFNSELLNIPYWGGQECLADYAYASTCHKAQGSEWKTVLTIGNVGIRDPEEALAWTYTAISRAKDRVIILK
jgi:exodeoxyribonuclease V